MKYFHTSFLSGGEKPAILPGVEIEKLGNGYLVRLPTSDDVVYLRDPLSEVLRLVLEGGAMGRENVDAITRLRDLGILETPRKVSRRTLLGAAAGGAMAGATVLAMPTVASASSVQCPTITVSNAGDYIPAQIWFSIGVGETGHNNTGPTFFDVGSGGLPSGTYYYRASAGEASPGGPAFVYLGQIEITVAGSFVEVPRAFFRDEHYPNNHPVTAELFSDPARQCLIATTPVLPS